MHVLCASCSVHILPNCIKLSCLKSHSVFLVCLVSNIGITSRLDGGEGRNKILKMASCTIFCAVKSILSYQGTLYIVAIRNFKWQDV